MSRESDGPKALQCWTRVRIVSRLARDMLAEVWVQDLRSVAFTLTAIGIVREAEMRDTEPMLCRQSGSERRSGLRVRAVCSTNLTDPEEGAGDVGTVFLEDDFHDVRICGSLNP